MNPEEWQKIKSLFNEVIDMPVEQQRLFLDKACADNQSLRSEIESLINFHQKAENFLEKPFVNFQDQNNFSKEDTEADLKRLIGSLLDGQYHIESLLGKGGMGAVYLARHALLHHYVAIKIMSPHISADPKYKQLFLREGRAATLFRHPNVITIHDLRETPDGIIFMVLEYIEGHTLKDELNNRKRFSPAEALQLISPIASALNTAHERGVIHRDLKPSNIMIGRSSNGLPVVKLLDLGVAKINVTQTFPERSHFDGMVTCEGIGTPHYMSPEQFEKNSNIDARSDIYSLGVIVYELVTGHRPFEGDSFESLAGQHTSSIPTPLNKAVPDIPKEFSHAITRAMAKNRANRQTTCNQFIDELTGALNRSNNVSTDDQYILHRSAGISQRRIVATGLIVILSLFSILFFVNFRSDRSVVDKTNYSFSPPIKSDEKEISKDYPGGGSSQKDPDWKVSGNPFEDIKVPFGYWEGKGSAKDVINVDGKEQLWRAEFNFWFILNKDGEATGEAELIYDAEMMVNNRNSDPVVLKISSPGKPDYSDPRRKFPIVGIMRGKELILDIAISEEKRKPLEFSLRADPNLTEGTLVIRKIKRTPFSPFVGMSSIIKNDKDDFITQYEYRDDQNYIEWSAIQSPKKREPLRVSPELEEALKRLRGRN